MLGNIINVLTAPGEAYETIVKEYNWKQALLPIGLLMILAVLSGIILQDQIADLQWKQVQKNIESSTRIPEDQKEEILSDQYDRIYNGSVGGAIFSYFAMAVSWPVRIVFFSVLTLLAGNLFFGGAGKYGQVFTLTSFAYSASVVEYILKTPIQYFSNNIMIFTGLGVLGVGDQGEFLNSFLSGIDLFAFWRVFLIAVGMGILYNKETKTTLISMTLLWLTGLAVLSGIGAVTAAMFG